jgi:glycosyltransferase involved in cell wall biosynthesis
VTGRPLRILGVGNARSVIFLRWAWRLTELGHEVHVVSDRFSEQADEPAALTTYDIRSLGGLNGLRGVRRLRFGATIARLADELEIDVIHGHYLLPYGFWAALGARRPLVVSPWGTDILVDAQKGGRDLRRAHAALSAADAIVVNSEANARAARLLGVDPARIEKIVWYADLARFAPEHRDAGLRARFGWPDDSLVALSLRNFRPDTNIDVVVRAFGDVAAAEPRARLLLAAKGGPLQGEIESLVERSGLRSRVAFCSVGEDELPALVASADVLLAMTRSDSTPSSLLEAMASGLPAVCAHAASIDEWLAPGEGGELVPQLDEKALAAAVLGLFRDPELRRRYGERNRLFVGEHVIEAGPALETVYRRLLDTDARVSAAARARRPAVSAAVVRSVRRVRTARSRADTRA